ncbi:hypothetical protein MUSASHINO07_08650 [Gemella sp. Musashino-2025]
MVFRMILYIYREKIKFYVFKKRGNIMFLYWLIILVMLAKVFTFFEKNKLKIVKRKKYTHR